jgi:hypothetical protein
LDIEWDTRTDSIISGRCRSPSQEELRDSSRNNGKTAKGKTAKLK